ncbi:MAG: DUF4474 domain-containing protein [Roseburia sp.]|nr:DUF4474 domain-containing protein [Roseburia sp.]
MDKTSVFIIIFSLILLVCFAGLFYFLYRRRKSKRKVRSMLWEEKRRLLNELASPFGFAYLQEEDVFTGKIDAWQRKSGYEALFDKAAAHFHMIFDAFPVYFDYEGRTWLIEFWKGQYGINTGAEVGVYHADRIVPEEEREKEHFQAVDDGEMPLISYCLEKKKKRMYSMKWNHWWLASFRMGEFSHPKDLQLMTVLTFQNPQLAKRFYEGIQESGCGESKFRFACNEVHLRMDWSDRHGFFSRLYRSFIQLQNKLCCLLYGLVTHPFHCTVDKLLFLYFLFPRCFRKMLQISAHGKRRQE